MAALYNKYRPRKLSQLRGQEHIKKILANQIEKNDLAHAYLFSGPAGTGKTSVARIVAACVNCSTGITVSPPMDDPNVQMIISGSNQATDVLELDAATNNGIDDIRAIRDQMAYAPSTMRKKVFIIDECHRLSSQAWEGLLKMLEEPPEYAIFILCTTEPEKVTETVRTRCMTFDFRLLSKQDVLYYLSKIAEHEKIDLEPAALDLLATAAKGSLRMGISKLAKLKDLGGRITVEQVSEQVGMPSGAAARAFLHAVVAKDFLGALKASSSMISIGVKAPEFIACLAELCHDLVVSSSKSYDLTHYGYTPDEAQEVAVLRDEMLKHLPPQTFRMVLRTWIWKLNEQYGMTVYNLNPQMQVNYTFVELYEIFRIQLKKQ